jgi:cytochrome b561
MLKNNTFRYGFVAIFLHWFMALGVFFMFGLGLYMVELNYYDAWYKGSLDLHKSIGVMLFMFLCIRFCWRMVNVNPAFPLAHSQLEKFEFRAAHLMHLLLYLMLFLLMCSGYLISTADGRGILVFELIEIPAIGSFVENQEDVAGEIHFILAWCLIGFIALHSGAAIKHHIINKDNTLKKMLGINK